MRRGATRVVAAVSLSRLAGLIRERIVAQYLGTSAAADAFGAAFRITMLLEQIPMPPWPSSLDAIAVSEGGGQPICDRDLLSSRRELLA